MMQVRFVPRFARGLKGLLSLYPGPVAEADPSLGLEHSGWALWIDPGNTWRMARLHVQPPENAAPPSHLADIPGAEVEHLTLAFDQNGRRVIAFQRGNTTTISFMVPGPPPAESRVSWPGVDPLIFFDGLLRDHAGGAATDLIVFYLSVDRVHVRYRMQFESYGIERTWGTLPEPASLDAIARFQNQVGVWFATRSNPHGHGVMISDPYPFVFSEAMALSLGLISGTYAEVVVTRDPVAHSMGLSAGLQSGTYAEVVVMRDAVAHSMNLSAGLQSGTYTEVVVMRDAVAHSMNLTAALHGGDYVLRTIGGGEYAHGMNLTAGLIGGTYAPG